MTTSTPHDRALLGASLTLPCGTVVPNRLAKSALSEALGTEQNAPKADLAVLYERWARGGAGLLITGNVMIDRRALGEPANVAIEDDRDLAPLAAWARAGTAGGNQLWMQLNHPGRQSPRGLSPEPVAPSPVPMTVGGGLFAPPRALTDAEIEGIIERFGVAAAVAKQAGFTGVQIHGAHGYLVSQFLSPRTNQREDRWGGSPANRRRFVLAVAAAIREAVGPAFPVAIKLNSADFQRGGFSAEDSMAVVESLGAAGLDLIEISGGTYEAPVMMAAAKAAPPARESTLAREAYFLDYAREVRQRVRVPLMLTGGFRSASAMAAALAEGAVDMIGLGRPIAIEPDLPSRLLAGTAACSAAAPRGIGLAALDGYLEIAWHTQQLHRMGRGLDPDPGRSPWLALGVALLDNGLGFLRPKRS